MPAVVNFNVTGPGLFIEEISAGGDNELDWLEIYSEWKDWAAQSDNLKYPPAFRVVGGDPISDVQNLGSTFFLLAPWKLRPAELDHRLILNGNIFTDPAGESPVVATLGTYTVLVEGFVSNLVDAAVARLDLSQLLDAIYIDPIEGDDANPGTNTEPVATIAAAQVLADANNLHQFKFRGTITLTQDYTNFVFQGDSEISSTVNLNGRDVDNCTFKNTTMAGTMTGRIEADFCRIGVVSDLDGLFRECGFTSSFSTANNAACLFINCHSDVAGIGTPIVSVGSNNDISFRNWSGGLELQNVTAGDTISVDLDPGRLILDSSCTGGAVTVRGLSELTDNSAGTAVTQGGLLQSSKANKAALAAALAAAQ